MTIDVKNRLLIPSQIRKSLNAELDGTSFFVTLNGTIPWFYPRGYFKELMDIQVGPNLSPSDSLQKFTHLKLSMADELEWDNQGRVLLTPSIMSRAQFGKDRDVTLIGSKDHLELWKRDTWNERRELLISESPQIEEWGQKTLLQPSPASNEPVK